MGYLNEVSRRKHENLLNCGPFENVVHSFLRGKFDTKHWIFQKVYQKCIKIIISRCFPHWAECFNVWMKIVRWRMQQELNVKNHDGRLTICFYPVNEQMFHWGLINQSHAHMPHAYFPTVKNTFMSNNRVTSVSLARLCRITNKQNLQLSWECLLSHG